MWKNILYLKNASTPAPSFAQLIPFAARALYAVFASQPASASLPLFFQQYYFPLYKIAVFSLYPAGYAALFPL